MLARRAESESEGRRHSTARGLSLIKLRISLSKGRKCLLKVAIKYDETEAHKHRDSQKRVQKSLC